MTSYKSRGTQEWKTPALLMTFLNKLLNGGQYRVVGGFIRDNDEGYWGKPVTTQHTAKSTLLIFKRI